MKYAYALLALAAAVSAAPAPVPEAAPEAQPDAAPAAPGYGKYADYGKYPPPAGGYGKYADYGKYGAKDKREAEASPDGYGKYANYGMFDFDIFRRHKTDLHRQIPTAQGWLWKIRRLRQVRSKGQEGGRGQP